MTTNAAAVSSAPQTARPAERNRARWSPLLCAVAVTFLTLIAWVRLPSLTRRTVWAEDGGVFLRDVLSLGGLRSIPVPYDGYLHVVPRTMASLASTLAPVDAYAGVMSLLSCFVVAVVAVAVYFLSRTVFESRALRAMLAVIPILLPVAPQEVLGNAANLHWYLLWLAPWLLLYKPISSPGRVLLFAAALLTATSEIITGMFLPLAIWAIVARKNLWGPVGLILGVALQLLTTLMKPRFATMPIETALDPLSVIYGFFLLPLGSIWNADSRSLGSAIGSVGWRALVVPGLLLLAIVAYTVAVGRPLLKFVSLGLLGSSIVCWTASVVLSGNRMFGYSSYVEADWTSGFGYVRYAAAPAMFLLALVPVFVAAVAERDNARSGTSHAFIAAAFVVVLLGSYFPAATARQGGPDWAAGVADARAICTSNPTLEAAGVFVAPTVWKFAEVQVPCARLRGP